MGKKYTFKRTLTIDNVDKAIDLIIRSIAMNSKKKAACC